MGALLALAAALLAAFWDLFGPSSRTRRERRRTTDRVARRVDAQDESAIHGKPPPGEDEPDDAPPRSLIWLVASAGAGWAAVVVLGRLNPFEGDLFYRWLILGAAWLAAVFLGAPSGTGCQSPPQRLRAAALAIAINLLAAGGIGIPTVALGLWSMVAMGLNLRDDRASGRLRELDSRTPAFVLSICWAAIIGTFIGLVWPFWRSEAAMAAADAAMNRRPPDYDAAEKLCLRAIEEDRYSARPWLKSAALHWTVWRERGAKVEDAHWKTIPILYQMAATFPRNRDAWALHSDRARSIQQLLGVIGARLDPVEALRYRAKIVEATRTATLLNPTSAVLHARLAESSAAIDMYEDAVTEAEAALRLDRLTPHRDKRLDPAVREHLDAQLPGWRENAAKMPIKPAR